MVKIIGIDPGLASTGIGIVRGTGHKVATYSFGSIHTSKNHSLPHRLDKIYSGVLGLIKKEAPDLLVIEDAFSMSAYPKSGITLGKVMGVVLLAGYKAGVNVIEISVREAKQALTGNGNASKKQLEKSVRHFLKHPEQIKPDHASDAVALAIIGLFRYDSENISASGGIMVKK